MRLMDSLNPYIAGMIDDYVTGFNGYDEPEELFCCGCGRRIKFDEDYYDVNENIYCLECNDLADDAILEKVRSEYIFTRE